MKEKRYKQKILWLKFYRFLSLESSGGKEAERVSNWWEKLEHLVFFNKLNEKWMKRLLFKWKLSINLLRCQMPL